MHKSSHLAQRGTLFAALFFGCFFLMAIGCGDAQIALPELLEVIEISPENGAVQVSQNPELTIFFSDNVDRSQLSTSAIRLLDESANTVAVETLFLDDDRAVQLVPLQVLAGQSVFQIVVDAGILGRHQAASLSAFSARFTTRSATP